ncbi:hypothetical protein [Listeria seeligeri]|uniref:hypothetical protein n=1 Tax=Listeria seeligeri TaxID=1640 RepID=UPI0010D88D68|nr:hypothetical protein [Listeria seeligeri]MBC1578046.1 hypothetical protein [Listeria seeligeri]MBC1726234.1 hypothetical protein [Listeria seeligeri]MBC1731122.1 hypothetical protein [Listeria seeligeri]MBC1808923.1 hypothetical protein [Listeria seeligeri]MBC1894647.1 hypothetical protein [Listeria seeligeri]
MTKIKIAYIDDDSDAVYGPMVDIEKVISEIEKELFETERENFEIKICLVEIKDEISEDDFWRRVIKNNYHGMILDYKLVDSNIFDNANLVWRRIKLQNPLFPLAIYTSHIEAVTLDKNAESVFEKGNEEATNRMIEYLINQIKHNFNTIEVLERVNTELKNQEGISYAVIRNEEKIENQFSLLYESDYTEEEEVKFKELMDSAFDIISKYTKGDGGL